MKKTELQDAAFHDQTMMTREQMQASLEKELKGLHIFLSEVIESKATLDALVSVYWDRYVKLKVKDISPELPFKSNGVERTQEVPS